MKISFKKIACLGLALVTTLSLAACGGSEPNSGSNEDSKTSQKLVASQGLEFTEMTATGTDEVYGYLVRGIGDCKDSDLVIPATHKGLPVYVGSRAFDGCEQITSLRFQEDFKGSISNCAFVKCVNLKSAVLPKNISTVPTSCFTKCTSLTDVTFEGEVSKLDWYAFAGCTSLKTITFTSDAMRFEMGCFQNCTSLTDLYFPGTMEQWYENHFYPHYYGFYDNSDNWNYNMKNYTIHCTDGDI